MPGDAQEMDGKAKELEGTSPLRLHCYTLLSVSVDSFSHLCPELGPKRFRV